MPELSIKQLVNNRAKGIAMHYFKLNIGDYHKRAGRLNMLQHGAYNLLIQACYDREKFPTREEAIEWLWASTDEEIAAIDFVLNRLFVKKDDVFEHVNIAEDIASYKKRGEVNKKIAIERESKKRKKQPKQHESCYQEHESCTNEHEQSTNLVNQEPRTTNQEPLTKNQTDISPLACVSKTKKIKSYEWPKPDGVDPQHWEDWLQIRKAKRLPMSKSVMDKIEKEAAKINWTIAQVIEKCAQSPWAGFEAKWIERDQRAANTHDLSNVNYNVKADF